MLSLIKTSNNMYAWVYSNIAIFMGKYTETIAYGYWNFGIEKEEIHKALNLLTNVENEIIFKENKIINQKNI